LISYNSSTLKETSFSSVLLDSAFYAADHTVNGEKLFPGAGFVEMACIAGNIAGEQRVRKIKDIVWIQPFAFRSGRLTLRTSLKPAGHDVEFAISSSDDENEAIVHSEGTLAFHGGPANSLDSEDQISIAALKAKCSGFEAKGSFYDQFRKVGFQYGPSFQTVQEIYIGESFALSKLKIADSLRNDFGQFILHPCTIDGALQTAAGLIRGLEPASPHMPFALDEIEIFHPLRQTCYAYVEFGDQRPNRHAGVTKFNLRILNESGDVLTRFKNLFFRAVAKEQMSPRSKQAEGSAA